MNPRRLITGIALLAFLISPTSVFSQPVHYGTAEIRTIIDLFAKGRYRELNDVFSGYQKKCESNILMETLIADSFNVFYETDPTYVKRLDDWVLASNNSWVPLIARATCLRALGGEARGTNWAKDTSEGQIRGMMYYYSKAMRDINTALSMNSRIVPAYLNALAIYSATGDMETNKKLVRKALKIFPNSYLIRRMHIVNLTPRWGGSYEEMKSFAKESMPYAKSNPMISTLPGFIYWDQANMAQLNGNLPLAITLSKRALTYGENWNFRYGLAETYYFNREYDKALIELEKAMAIRPNIKDAYELRERILATGGRKKG